jgi:hypothetical protein
MHFCFLPRLEGVLRDFQHLGIVISSTWRNTRSLESLRSVFDPALQHQIIGVTPLWRDHLELFDVIGYQRHTEIEAWMRSSSEPWLPWVALDDKPYLFRPFLPNLVKTDPTTGFDENAELILRQLLATN